MQKSAKGTPKNSLRATRTDKVDIRENRIYGRSEKSLSCFTLGETERIIEVGEVE
jgi:hypothetical protein